MIDKNEIMEANLTIMYADFDSIGFRDLFGFVVRRRAAVPPCVRNLGRPLSGAFFLVWSFCMCGK